MTKKYLILIRHEKHKNNELSKNTMQACVNGGRLLAANLNDRNIPLPTIALSSSQKRTSQTLKAFVRGMRLNLTINTLKKLDDYKNGAHPFTKKETKQAILVALHDGERDFEPYLLYLFPEKCQKRARESWSALAPIIRYSDRSLILCSHGCSRPEELISSLQNQPADKPQFIFERDGVAILTLTTNNDIKLELVDYMGKLTV